MLDAFRELLIVDTLQCQSCGEVWRQERYCGAVLDECECPRCDARTADWFELDGQRWEVLLH